MNELTLELFEALSQTPELSDEGRERALPWLTALLRLPYLTQDEKANALALLDFLEGIAQWPHRGAMHDSMAGAEPLAPLCRAVRARLRLTAPTPWDMAFPDNYRVEVNGEQLRVEDLRARGVEHVDFRLSKPIRGSMEYVTVRRLHADGRVEQLPEYRVFDAPPVGERHVFNVYGEKAIGGANAGRGPLYG